MKDNLCCIQSFHVISDTLSNDKYSLRCYTTAAASIAIKLIITTFARDYHLFNSNSLTDMKKVLLTLLCLMGVLGLRAAEQELAASLLLGADNWDGNSAYTETLTSKDGNWTLVNFNNNKNGWTNPSSIKCGRKNYDSTGEIITAKAIDKAIEKVTLDIYSINTANVSSITLYVADDDQFTNATAVALDAPATGENNFTIAQPAANKFYKVEFVCTSASSNGVVAVSGLNFYYTPSSSPVEPPVDPGTPDLPGVAEGADDISCALFGITAGKGAQFKAYTAAGTTGTAYNAILRNANSANASAAPAMLFAAGNDMSGVVNTTSTGIARKVTIYWNASATKGQVDIYGSDKAYASPSQLYAGERTVIGNARMANAVNGATTVTLTGNWPYIGIRPVSGKVTIDRIDIEWEEAPVVLQPAALAFSAATATATIGEQFTAPVLTKATDAAVVYSSGNTAVATVDAATGAVTLVAAGQAVITAKAEATATYEAGTASYTLTVKEAQGPVTPPADGTTATFDFTAPAALNPTQQTPGEGADAAVNVSSVTFTSGDVNVSFNVPAGKTDTRLYLYKGNTELRLYKETSMTVAVPQGVITGITFDVSFDDNINATPSTGAITTGKPTTWAGEAQSVTFDWTATSKINKMTVTYKSEGSGPVTPPVDPDKKEVTDQILPASFGVPTGEGSSYETKTSAALASGAVYEANLMTNPEVGTDKEKNVIQLRWTAGEAAKQAGIVATKTGGTVKSVKVDWNANTNAARVLAVYGSHTAYTTYADLQDEAKCGTELGQIKFSEATNNVSTLDIPAGYEYIAFRSTSGALYLNGIDVTWLTEGDSPVNPPVGEGALAKWLEAKPAVDTPLDAALTAVYQNGKDLWVTQGGAWALVYGELGQTYTNGDLIPAPVTGKYEEFNGMPEFVPVASTFGAATAGAAVVAEAVEISSITTADAARYVRLEGVSITADASDEAGLNFIASDGASQITLRNRYSSTISVPVTESATVYGFVGINNGTVQIYPVIIENDEPVGPAGGTATFDFNAPASLSPAQAMPGEGADNAVNITDVVFTDGPVNLSFYMPADLAGKSKDPRLYLYKGTPELRMYSGTSMTIAAAGAKITGIEFIVSYDDNINGTASTGTLTAGKPTKWVGDATSVTFDWSATSKANKIIVSYEFESAVDAIESADADAPVEYYNLQGVRVENPSAGIYIRRQGNTVTKVLVK